MTPFVPRPLPPIAGTLPYPYGTAGQGQRADCRFGANPVYSAPYSSATFKPLSPAGPIFSAPYNSATYNPQAQSPCALDASIPFRLSQSIAASLASGGASLQVLTAMAKLTSMLNYPLATACIQASAAKKTAPAPTQIHPNF